MKKKKEFFSIRRKFSFIFSIEKNTVNYLYFYDKNLRWNNFKFIFYFRNLVYVFVIFASENMMEEFRLK